MGRKDKQITDHSELESIIANAQVCRIGLALNDIPYIVPVNFGYDNNCLFFHSTHKGKKIDIIKQNNNVCFEIDIDTGIITNSENPCKATMKYRSVIGTGKAYFITDITEKRRALESIVKHYIPEERFEFDERLFKMVEVIKIEIVSITGKQSGH
jgi:hypothetical protein